MLNKLDSESKIFHKKCSNVHRLMDKFLHKDNRSGIIWNWRYQRTGDNVPCEGSMKAPLMHKLNKDTLHEVKRNLLDMSNKIIGVNWAADICNGGANTKKDMLNTCKFLNNKTLYII